MTIPLGLAAVLALILINGYFVAAEFGFVAARRGRLEELADEGDAKARRAVEVQRKLSFVLSGAQLGITASSLLLGFIAEPVFSRALVPLLGPLGLPPAASRTIAVGTGFIVSTAAQMVLGELGPKNLAIARPEQTAMALAASTALYSKLAGPVIRLFDNSANGLLRLLGIEPAEELHTAVSPEELEVLVTAGGPQQGSLTEAQAALFRRALAFRQLKVADAMVPRPQVVAVDARATCEDLQGLVLASGHSRFPVVGEDLDDIKGVVHGKDILRIDPDARPATGVTVLVKPALVVPESAPLRTLLSDLRQAHSQTAIVVDEHGGTAGIVTLEDVVEELVGEIEDEYDLGGPSVQELGPGRYLVPGTWRLDELVRDTGIALPPGEYDTVSGLVMAQLGRVPQAGDSLEVDGARILVEQMDGFAVGLAVVVRPPVAPGGEQQ